MIRTCYIIKYSFILQYNTNLINNLLFIDQMCIFLVK